MRLTAAALMLVASTSAQAQDYTPVETAPIVLPAASPPTAAGLGDDATKQVDLGFTFTYFGQDFTKAWISSNGFVSFQSPANLCCNGQTLNSAQRNTIYEYWTDLINWSGTPHYSKKVTEDGINVFMVGWYNTYEYGTQNPNSFEMYLYENGGIHFNYTNTADMRYHTVTAGLTGPTSLDNISLFYGSNTGSLSGKAYSFNYKTGTVTVDCSTMQLDPSCAGSPVDTSPVSIQQDLAVTTIEQQTSSPIITQEVITQQVTEQAVSSETSAPVVESAPISTASTASTTTVSTSVAARLSPDQLIAMNSKGASTGSDTQGATLDLQQSGLASSENSFQLFTNASNASIVMSQTEQDQQQEQLKITMESSFSSQNAQQIVKIDQVSANNSAVDQVSTYTTLFNQSSQEDDKSTIPTVQSAESSNTTGIDSKWQDTLSNQAAMMEALTNISTGESKKEDNAEASPLGEKQNEVMSQIAYVPGFSAYKLVVLPDRPDFYKPKRIYNNSRPVDAYMSLYKMTVANDSLWKQIVESQYE